MSNSVHHADYRYCQYKEVGGSYMIYWTVFLHGKMHSTISATEILSTLTDPKFRMSKLGT